MNETKIWLSDAETHAESLYCVQFKTCVFIVRLSVLSFMALLLILPVTLIYHAHFKTYAKGEISFYVSKGNQTIIKSDSAK